MKSNIAYVVIDEDIKNALAFQSNLSAFTTLAFEEWDCDFFEKNIQDLLKGETVIYEGATYQFYNADDFSDLDS